MIILYNNLLNSSESESDELRRQHPLGVETTVGGAQSLIY